MILPIVSFKAKLVEIPKTKGDKDTPPAPLDNFTVGKKYRVYSIFDSGKGFSDFLIRNDARFYCWINLSFFKG